jgi:hypothetical protein
MFKRKIYLHLQGNSEEAVCFSKQWEVPAILHIMKTQKSHIMKFTIMKMPTCMREIIAFGLLNFSIIFVVAEE